MRHKILTILALLCLTATSAWALEETVGGYTWTYTVSDNKAAIGAVNPSTGDITIPSSLGGNPVTSISDGAFLNRSGLTSVIIPASVTSIGTSAFYGCSGLTTVDIPASVTEIGDFAFAHCSGLTTVTIGNGVTNIGPDAFYDCTNVTDVYCYANPSALTWDETGGQFQKLDDFNYDANNLYTKTKFHVFNTSAWSGFTSKVNVTFEPLTDNEKAVSVTANKESGSSSNYWCTYYNPLANVQVPNGVDIYKATIQFNGAGGAASGVTLTNVTGNNKVIKVGEAVMLKATSGTISMELTSVASDGDYSGNNLEGGTTVEPGYGAYTLSRGTSQTGTMGFYQFTGNLDGSKAHLEIGTAYQPARGFVGFDDEETTAIRPTLNPSLNGGEWYDLSGRRLSGQPTKKGVYVRNGQKFIVK